MEKQMTDTHKSQQSSLLIAQMSVPGSVNSQGTGVSTITSNSINRSMSNSAPSTPKTKHRRKFSMGSIGKDKKKKEQYHSQLKDFSDTKSPLNGGNSDCRSMSESGVNQNGTSSHSPYGKTNRQSLPPVLYNEEKDVFLDDSDEESLDSEQTNSEEASPVKPQRDVSGQKGSRDWEILEGLKDGQTCEQKPDKYDGYMMKRRKWPMKGWHKRFFVIENGILTYAKSSADIMKGKYHGTVDIGLSVLTYKKERRRIDIDAEDLIYHLKVKQSRMFDEWIHRLRHHRLYRQHEIAFGTKDAPRLTDVSTPVDDFATPITSPVQPVGPVGMSFGERTINRGSFKTRTMDRAQSKVAAWLLDSSGMESCYKDLNATQAKIFELGSLMEKLQSLQLGNGYSDASLDSPDHLSSTSASKKEKSGKRERGLKFRKEQKKSNDKLVVPNGPEKSIHLSVSNPSLISMEGNRGRPVSLPDTLMNFNQESQLREQFMEKSKATHSQLKHLLRTITTERERLKQAVCSSQSSLPGNVASYIQALKTALADSLKQNEEYKSRLNRIHAESSISSSSIGSPTPVPSVERLNGSLGRDVKPPEHPLLTNSASWESQSAQSVSEFYDAEEYILTSEESSEEEEEEDEAGSDMSESENTVVAKADEDQLYKASVTGRRCVLPVPRPEDANVSLWGLLRKNIGKDLSKISMPVTLNEPLSLLQRLCEELEYSELLDKAADTEDPYQRMILVAAFSVSPYAATYYRAGQKPFNPLLGETYECIREDKGWKFIAEQVSHHPPISACYCESKNFQFWQDVQIKTKFWGKSMEIQPIGRVHLKLPRYKDHYSWNKPTTCVHNLLGGSRWVDHYGEINVINENNGVKCRLTYSKTSYWSNSRHEVYGSVISADNRVLHHLFGKWNEGLYYGEHPSSAKCIWRPGSMPEDFDLYYGFTRFAIELNELESDQVKLYAPTDTRFRPDQRLLEEGKIPEAEAEKHRVENMQREKRKQRESEKVTYTPRWFMKVNNGEKEDYMYTGKYYELRKEPGLGKIKLGKLW